MFWNQWDSCLVVVHFRDIHLVLPAAAHKPFAVPVCKLPEEVLVHVPEAVSLARQEEDIEALVRTDQGVDYPDGIRRMNIVVHIARAEQQMALQIPCQLRICLDVVNESRVPVLDFLLYAVMLRRQRATAIIAAREKIVEGAVSMVKMALDKLNNEGVMTLDDDKKAAMVSNLLVVLCSDDAAQPVVNTSASN